MTSKVSVSETAPIGDTVSNLTDWVELKVLTSQFYAYNLNDLSSLVEEYEDEENEDFLGQDLFNEEAVIKVAEEVEHRGNCLKEAYPFELGNSDTEIRLKSSDMNIGRWIYLYCLLISHAKADGVNNISFTLNNDDRDLLQVASTYAAVGHFGEAISFGFPRPDNSGFLTALKDVLIQVGEGEAKSEISPGYSKYVKDGGVDLIAWEPMNDSLPGMKFLLGQVATGYNWKDKSIVGEIRPFLDSYCATHPKSTPIPAMFIPFCIDEENEGSRKDVMLRLTMSFGIIYYRLRLPYYALLAFHRSEATDFTRKDEDYKIKNFVESMLGGQLLKDVSAA